MTIAIISKNFPLIPLATERTFQTFWKPASTEIGLQWVPLFEYGVTIEKQDYEIIKEEILLLKKWIESQDIECVDKIYLLKRIDFITKELEIRFALENDLYIG